MVYKIEDGPTISQCQNLDYQMICCFSSFFFLLCLCFFSSAHVDMRVLMFRIQLLLSSNGLLVIIRQRPFFPNDTLKMKTELTRASPTVVHIRHSLNEGNSIPKHLQYLLMLPITAYVALSIESSLYCLRLVTMMIIRTMQVGSYEYGQVPWIQKIIAFKSLMIHN